MSDSSDNDELFQNDDEQELEEFVDARPKPAYTET